MYLWVVYARVDDVEPDWLEEQRADAVEEDEDGHEKHEHLQSQWFGKDWYFLFQGYIQQ